MSIGQVTFFNHQYCQSLFVKTYFLRWYGSICIASPPLIMARRVWMQLWSCLRPLSKDTDLALPVMAWEYQDWMTQHTTPSIVTATASEKCAYVWGLAQKVVDNKQEKDISDTVYNYSRVLCHYGEFSTDFQDALTERDRGKGWWGGCWWLFLPCFKAARNEANTR